MTFSLHPQLAADTLPIGELPLCRVLLMNNRQFPWLVLVPRQENLRELFDLNLEDYVTVMNEVRLCSESLCNLTQAHKINIAALGNIVPQLHIHVIARSQNDAAWPNPVWNFGVAAQPYAPEAAKDISAKIRTKLGIA